MAQSANHDLVEAPVRCWRVFILTNDSIRQNEAFESVIGHVRVGMLDVECVYIDHRSTRIS